MTDVDGERTTQPDGDAVKLTAARLRRKRAQAIAKKYARQGFSVVDEFLAKKHIEAEQEIYGIEPDGEPEKRGASS